jgi:hypothetical protein
VSPVTVLPLSARFALWFSGWTTSATSLDDARDEILAGDAAHHIVGLPGEPDPVPLIIGLGLLRAAGATGAGIALPVPGDLLGLAGPAAFNAEAVDAGEAVVLDVLDLGLVPHRAGAGVTWRCLRAVSLRQLPDPSEADSSLRTALLRTSENLVELDVARWRPAVADELLALRRSLDLPLPPTMAPRAVRVASLATRCRTIVELALADDGGSVSAREADARRAALAPLDHAARRGLVAACAYPWDR